MSATEVSLRLDGDPEACFRSARLLAGWRDALDDTRRSLRSGLADTEASWSGDAAEAFRDRLTLLIAAVEKLANTVGRLHAGLTTFADELCTVRVRLAGAAAQARGSGLRVYGDRVLPPDQGAAPDQMYAFDDVTRLVAGIRQDESLAHRVLRGVLDAALPASGAAWAFFGAGLASGVVGGYAGQAAALRQLAAAHGARAATLRGRLQGQALPSTDRVRLWMDSTAARVRSDGAAARATKIESTLAKGGPVTKGLDMSLSSVTGRLPFAAKVAPVTSKLPVVGLVGTGMAVRSDMKGGMSTTEAVAKHTTVMATSMAAGGLTSSTLMAAGFAGGPVVGAAVVSGVVVAAGVGYAWDHREQIADFAEGVGEGAKELATDARNAVGDAAGAATTAAGELVDGIVPDFEKPW